MASLEQLHEMKTELKDVQIVSLATAESFGDFKRIFASKKIMTGHYLISREIYCFWRITMSKLFRSLFSCCPKLKLAWRP